MKGKKGGSFLEWRSFFSTVRITSKYVYKVEPCRATLVGRKDVRTRINLWQKIKTSGTGFDIVIKRQIRKDFLSGVKMSLEHTFGEVFLKLQIN